MVEWGGVGWVGVEVGVGCSGVGGGKGGGEGKADTVGRTMGRNQWLPSSGLVGLRM